MEFLKAQGKYVGDMWRGLSLSGRAALGLSLVVLAAGMWGMLGWAGDGGWTPLLDQPLAAEHIQRVQAELVTAGVDARVEGDRILIHGGADERQMVMALLAEREALPRDTSTGYAALFAENNVFDGDQKTRWKQMRGLETELARTLRRFRGVRDASVNIVVPQQRGFSVSRAPASSASVMLTVRDRGTLNRAQVAAIAHFVAGAVPGLEPKDVSITDGSRDYRVSDPVAGLSSELLELQRDAEEHHEGKILRQLAYIEGVLISVRAAMRDVDETATEAKLGKPQISRETNKEDEMTEPAAAQEPAARPNVRQNLTQSGSGASSTRTETETEFAAERDKKVVQTVKRPGVVESLAVAVNVPRSYLERVFEQEQASASPDPSNSIEKVTSTELKKVEDQVRPLIAAVDDAQIQVNWYYDAKAEPAARAEDPPTGIAALLRDYGAQGGLALLVLVSMFMVWRLARAAQASLTPDRAGALSGAGAGGPIGAGGVFDSFGGDVSAVGEAAELVGVLEGREVDEKVVRTQQIVKQIGDMVRDDPAAAAGLVERWIQSAK